MSEMPSAGAAMIVSIQHEHTGPCSCACGAVQHGTGWLYAGTPDAAHQHSCQYKPSGAPSVSSSAPPRHVATTDEVVLFAKLRADLAYIDRHRSGDMSTARFEIEDVRTVLDLAEERFTARQSSLSPVQEEATPTLDAATLGRLQKLLSDLAAPPPLKTSDFPFGVTFEQEERLAPQRADLATLAAALPALLEASRQLNEIGAGPYKVRPGRGHFHVEVDGHDIGGCYDELSAITEVERCNKRWRAERLDRIAQLETELSGCIRERETLKAELTEAQDYAASQYIRIDALRSHASELERQLSLARAIQRTMDACIDKLRGESPKPIAAELVDIIKQLAESQSAVARLTTEKAAVETERDKFRGWFQNAEQARAVAIAERDSAQADLDVSLNLLERQEASLASRATCIAQLETQLEAAQRVREQAIHDIEALPSMRLVNMDNREVIARDEVRRILREAPTNG